MKTTVVIFDKETGCRILTNPDSSLYEGKQYAINPDRSRVEHLPPHAWELVGGRILPAEDSITQARAGILHAPKPTPAVKKRFPLRTALDVCLFIVGVVLIILRILHV